MMYQMETYIWSYLRLAMVPKIFTPNMIQATTTRMSSGSGSSAYSRPWLMPASRQTTALRMMTFHSMAVATPSFSLHSFTPQSRGTRK